jgi:hypothetical protein
VVLVLVLVLVPLLELLRATEVCGCVSCCC